MGRGQSLWCTVSSVATNVEGGAPVRTWGTRESRGVCSGSVQLSCYVVECNYEVLNNASERDFGEVGVGPRLPKSSEGEPSGVTPV